jgi:hypothetical protein
MPARAGGGTTRRGCLLRPAKTGNGTVGEPLKLPELALAGRAPAIEPRSIELEALATIARFVTQPLSLVPHVPLCAHGRSGSDDSWFSCLHRRRAVDVARVAGGSAPNACSDECGLLCPGAILFGTRL